MTVKKALFVLAVIFLVTFAFSTTGTPARTLASSGLPTATPTAQGFTPPAQETPPPQYAAADQAIRAAFQDALGQNRNQVLGTLIYDTFIDHIEYSKDGTTALLWLGLRDQSTGQVVASEPGLSIARNLKQGVQSDPSSWAIALPSSDNLATDLNTLPPELLTQEIRERFLSPQLSAAASSGQVFSGYKLPWTAGLTKYVTNAIGHYLSVSGGLASCPSTCQYAFDFADGTMFPLIAAKGGTVKSFRWTCANGDHNCTNFLILEDQSTIPTSYQVYYHMAYNTLSDRLRTVGAPVLQGEYLGNADNTGYSTGHHLHFMVYTTKTAADWSWGYSVDITFDDVTNNGGRPRTCAEAAAYPNLGSQCMPGNAYTSGNTPAHPPSGTLELPPDRQMITSPTVRVQGTASDDIEITRIQVLANYDGSWKSIDDITPTGNGPYAKDVDLCAANVPDGPFKMAVRIYDREGSLAPGMPERQLIKAYACGGIEPPVISNCTPASNQVALYAKTDFRGDCQLFNVNQSSGYTSSALTTIGDNTAASIKIGSGVRAILYDRSSDVSASTIAGRVETFESNDAGLADNRIGVGNVSGLWVLPRTLGPDEPFLKPVGNQFNGSVTSLDSLVLAWDGGAGANAFDLALSGPGTNLAKTVTGSSANSWSVGNLGAGTYTFSVKAKNGATTNNTNTSSKTFTVTSASFPAAANLALPFSDNMESGAGGWVKSGLWQLGSLKKGDRDTTNAWIFNNGTDYNDGTFRAGDLTSAPIQLPSSGTYYLRFAYYMDTENGNPYWDQRLVQISANDGPFTDLFQLSDDKQDGQIWLNSGPISLAGYAGKKIRLRFHFDTVNSDYNTGFGWAIDDLSVTTTAPDTSCADSNNSPDTAQALSLGVTVSGVICPERDVDYYKITATAGLPIVVDIDAKQLSPASSLDSYVSLLDIDKRSPLAENDDQTPGTLQDSWLPYVFQRAGTYYIKVKPWNYPGAGGQGYPYKITLRQNVAVAPQDVTILSPADPNRVPVVPFRLSASAVDYDGGPVAKVDFFWHSGDWSKEWVKVGSDTDGSDGWSSSISPQLYGDVQGGALYVQATSRTGGVKGAVLWDLQPDLATPLSDLQSLPGQIGSSVFLLNWTAADPQNDIDHFDLQYQEKTSAGTSNWKDWQDLYHSMPIPGNARSTWFSGTPGVSYNFRLRAADRAGNVEPWADQPEASTSLSASCDPDENEVPGQTQANAFLLARGDISTVFNFCRSSQAGAGDVDWAALDAHTGEDLTLLFFTDGGGTAFSINLYNGSGAKLNTWQSADYEHPLSARWSAPADGRYFLEIKPLHAEMAGTDMKYQMYYGPGSWLYMPLVNR